MYLSDIFLKCKRKGEMISMANQSTTEQKIKCKFCDTYCLGVNGYVLHLEEKHHDLIPKDMVPWQFYYYLKTGKTHGSCVMCKKDTKWNDETHKYNRFCDDPKCKEKYRKIFEDRMIGKYGKITLLNDPEMQRKMLANRKISGQYMFQNDEYHYKIPYTGSYERAFLEFLDLDLNFSSNDIFGPSPHTYYYIYQGEKHFYIPDFYIPSLNLEIEIKDGGDNPNMHHKIQEVDKEKERIKDNIMKSNSSTFNYIKIENKDHFKFFKYLEINKYQFQNGINKSIIMI